MDMKSISQKLQDDIRAIMDGTVNEALKGGQVNIDVNKNGKIDGQDFVKLRTMKKNPNGKVHSCATHVEHAVLGKGVTVSEDHAEPDENGNIEWYTVQFEHSTQQVLTKDLTITMSEAHVHEGWDDMVKYVKDKEKPQPNGGAGVKQGSRYGGSKQKDEKPVKEETQIDEKDEGKPGLMFKKIAAKAAAKYGSVEAGNRVAGAIRKKVLAKEGVEVTEEEIDAMFENLKDSYTFTEYLDEARAQFGDDDAVSIANDAYNKQDISLFIK